MLQTPLGVVVDAKDNIFVSDPLQHMVLKFDTSGHLLATIGANAGVKNPTFMAIDEGRRRLYVVDSHLHQVLVFDLDTLELKQSIGKRGDKNGEFNFPVGIAVGPDGSFAVTDTGSCSVQVFSPSSNSSAALASKATAPANLSGPRASPLIKKATTGSWMQPSTISRFSAPRAIC